MAVIRPFFSIRPSEEKADKIAALPYDVYNREAVSYTHLDVYKRQVKRMRSPLSRVERS